MSVLKRINTEIDVVTSFKRFIMGKGGNKEAWKQNIDNEYQKWKYNDLHQRIKTHFNNAGNRDDIPMALKQKVDDVSPILNDLTNLHDTVHIEESEGKEKVFVRDSNSNIKFLGATIEVPTDVAADDEVISCTIWKYDESNIFIVTKLNIIY